MNLLEGAKILSDLLEKRHGAAMDIRTADSIEASGALPLFHWLGIEPPDDGRQVAAEPELSST